MITLNDLTLMRGSKVLIEHGTAQISDAHKVGIIGRNGCGKSSLFAAILGDLAPELGSINVPKNIKIAYIGGGSRGWAWGLMSDLVSCENMSGEVFLYDIDFNALVRYRDILGKDCDSPFPFEVVVVENQFTQFFLLPGLFGLINHPVDKSSFPVVNVRDDRNVSDFLHIHSKKWTAKVEKSGKKKNFLCHFIHI